MSGLGEATFHLNHSCFRSFFNFLIFISSAFCHNCVNTIENLSTNQKRAPLPQVHFQHFQQRGLTRDACISVTLCYALQIKNRFFFDDDVKSNELRMK